MAKQTVFDWLAVTRNEGKDGWLRFYKSMTGHPLSNQSRFFKALDDFGHVILFESVIAASTRSLDGDPLNYIIAVAVSKTNDQIQEITDADRYKMNLLKSKHRVEMQNEELEIKILKAREIGEHNEHT